MRDDIKKLKETQSKYKQNKNQNELASSIDQCLSLVINISKNQGAPISQSIVLEG